MKNVKFLRNATTCLIIGLLAISCTSDDIQEFINPVEGYDFHYVGNDYGNMMIPRHFKNESTFILPGERCYTTDIRIKDDDIYILGNKIYTDPIEPSFSATPFYWKNGNPIFFTDDVRSAASGLFLDGDDIYICAREIIDKDLLNYKGKYWKNGEVIYLEGDFASSEPVDIFYKNNNVYVVGNSWVTMEGPRKAVIWKNGVPAILTNAEGQNCTVLKVFVDDNNDVYASGANSGSPYSKAMYWKNETPVELVSDKLYAYANNVIVDNGDVYVAGFESDEGLLPFPFAAKTAVYWKNGNKVVLGEGEAISIIVDNGNVIIGGRDINNAVKYWLNDEEHILQPSSNTWMVDFAVVPY